MRQSVTARLLAAALDLSEQLLDAQSRRGPARRDRLSQADASLNKLRLYLRLAHYWRWLSARSVSGIDSATRQFNQNRSELNLGF